MHEIRSIALWRQPDFLNLWVAQTISLFGSQVTLLALPLTAILVLDATPVEVGILSAASTAPFLLFGLLAGVWVDRRRRRPILIWTDLGRALLLGSIPLAALFGWLHIEHLYLVAFLAGVLTVLFDVAYQSYLPSLVSRAEVVEGNSKLELSRSLTQIAGPGLAGGLVQIATAPIALAIDSLSYLLSALFLGRIRNVEPPPATRTGSSIRREIAAGLRLVLGSPLLRPIAACTATWNLFFSLIQAVLILYATRELGIGPALLGVILAAGGPGALLGALIASWAARRAGVGPAIVGAAVVGGLSNLLIPLAGGSAALAAGLLAAALFLGGLTGTAYNVNQVSLRQMITPRDLQGRMNATMRFVVWGTLPIGSLLGGILGETLGLRPTLIVGALGVQLACIWLLRSPVRTLRDLTRFHP